MTSSLLTPRSRLRTGGTSGGTAAGSTEPTRILDWRHPQVASLLRQIGTTADRGTGAEPAAGMATLRRAHRVIATSVRPVYSVQDERPVSEVLRRGRGSCSQRL